MRLGNGSGDEGGFEDALFEVAWRGVRAGFEVLLCFSQRVFLPRFLNGEEGLDVKTFSSNGRIASDNMLVDNIRQFNSCFSVAPKP